MSRALLVSKHATRQLRLLPYALAAIYLCECGVRGDCEDWHPRLGMMYRRGEAAMVARGVEPSTCPQVERLLRTLNHDPTLLRQAALIHYAARKGLDPRSLVGVDEELVELIARALREASLL